MHVLRLQGLTKDCKVDFWRLRSVRVLLVAERLRGGCVMVLDGERCAGGSVVTQPIGYMLAEGGRRNGFHLLW